MTDIRIGFGTDIHRLVSGRLFVLGGVQIAADIGPDGHSDADVLLHALADALLGSLALGDLGTHFPNSDERWRDADSSEFVRVVMQMVEGRGYYVSNVDSVVDLEAVMLSPYIPQIREKMAELLAVTPDCVSVKAKTGEGVDAVGSGLAVKAQVIVLVQRSK